MRQFRNALIAVAITLIGVWGCAQTVDPRIAENRAIVERFVEAANERDFAQFDQLVAEDFVRHCQATPDLDIRSRDQFIEFIKQDASVFPDSRLTVHHLVTEGDKVAIWATYRGTQEGRMGSFPPTGKVMSIDFGGVFRIEDGKITELWVTWDNMAGLKQLGHFPPPAATDGS